ncbi:hypothetical protein BDDG_12665 [Blastomyces dermatitidis ATCC 18188]|uniref:Calcineurin-like phosphoesterase domain-containing protein n=1 Tax=Ajellomyces dermatitidis (strain ATCC 18188 / CBS 674.68) TaxID=653446 RepID=A0A0J9EPL1_AJEDA|nr:hypothetical protein BDDG_12665 [Blastomyces dermatitidis ATCC 18188]
MVWFSIRCGALTTETYKLLHKHPLHQSSTLSASRPSPSVPIKIVCISDTHNTQPDVLPGDVLIHAGDLTENGSFDEIQSQLSWLSSQPHQHKVVVAGNHDVLLDEGFLEKYPERRYGDSRTRRDLNWGTIHYIQNSSVTLNFERGYEKNPDHRPHRAADEGDESLQNRSTPPEIRSLSVYGSPWTPQYGVSAFQHARDEDVWTDIIPINTDIVVVHGPPRHHLDTRDFHRAGCPLLRAEIARVKPSLVVFGHIHVANGREKEVVLDRTRRIYEGVMNNWGGWPSLVWMACCVLFARLKLVFIGQEKMANSARTAIFVNASSVEGPENLLLNDPIVVEL